MVRLSEKELQKYRNLAKEVREDILDMIYKTKGPHIGCSFGIVDILVILYFKTLSINPKKPDNPNRDRFILSKGHAVPALYAVLNKRGFISRKILDGFAKDGGTLEQHPTRNIRWGIEASSGSVGHGLSVGAGMAVAAKYDKRNYRIFVLVGDGELDEGSNWEAMLFSAHHKLDNLVAIVDKNNCQILGRTKEVLNLEPLAEKWRSFGWEVRKINGHNFNELTETFGKIPFQKGKPSCIIAETAKGKGVSFMENELRWHDKCPDEKEYKKALTEIQSFCS